MPERYIVTRFVPSNEPGNWAERDIEPGLIFYRYIGNNYSTPAQEGNVLLSYAGPTQLPFFEFPLSALSPYVADDVTAPLPIASETLTANIIPWTPQRFSMEIPAKDGTVLVRLFENESGQLEAVFSDPPRHTEAAHIFIESVIQLWNSMC